MNNFLNPSLETLSVTQEADVSFGQDEVDVKISQTVRNRKPTALKRPLPDPNRNQKEKLSQVH